MKSLDIAAQYLGVQETEGSNDGPVLTAIRACLMPAGTPPCSWCALFVAWALCRAYGPVSQIDYRRWLREALDFEGPGGIPSKAAPWYVESCQSWWEYAMATRIIVDHPQPGDLFILLNADRHAHHMGFVTATNPESEFETIEGNTNQGGSVNGDGVYRRTRTAGPRTVFVRIPETLRA